MPMNKLATGKPYKLDQILLWSNPNIPESKSFYQKSENKYTNNSKPETFPNKNIKTNTFSYECKKIKK